MTTPFFIELEVRDYELDKFGVVNNAVYLNYLEHARHRLLLSVGIDAAEIAASGASLAVSALHLRFLRPLRSKDRFRVKATIAKIAGARVVFHQCIVRQGETVAEGWVEAVFLDKRGRPSRMSPETRAGFARHLRVEPIPVLRR